MHIKLGILCIMIILIFTICIKEGNAEMPTVKKWDVEKEPTLMIYSPPSNSPIFFEYQEIVIPKTIKYFEFKVEPPKDKTMEIQNEIKRFIKSEWLPDEMFGLMEFCQEYRKERITIETAKQYYSDQPLGYYGAFIINDKERLIINGLLGEKIDIYLRLNEYDNLSKIEKITQDVFKEIVNKYFIITNEIKIEVGKEYPSEWDNSDYYKSKLEECKKEGCIFMPIYKMFSNDNTIKIYGFRHGVALYDGSSNPPPKFVVGYGPLSHKKTKNYFYVIKLKADLKKDNKQK